MKTIKDDNIVIICGNNKSDMITVGSIHLQIIPIILHIAKAKNSFIFYHNYLSIHSIESKRLRKVIRDILMKGEEV